MDKQRNTPVPGLPAQSTLAVAGADGEEVLRERSPLPYTVAERQFSRFVQQRMYRLLRGDDDALVLMRRYCGDRPSVGFFMPRSIDKGAIRCGVAEQIVFGVLRFLDPFAPGGPVAQEDGPGRLEEVQAFPTHYPHIVIERRDVFGANGRGCLYTEWRAVRLQNQRKSTLINRALDLGNLTIELAKLVRVPVW